MAGRNLDLAAVALALCLGATQLRPDSPQQAPSAPVVRKPAPAFPPPPPAYEPLPSGSARQRTGLSSSPEAAIAQLSQRAGFDADPRRRAFAESTDLYAFMLQALPAARAGDGASAYYLYQVLDECRPYLRLAPEEARALAERLEPGQHGAIAEERQSWLRDDLRCFRFAGGDLGVIGAVLGADQPGAESEYASVLFERAADSGFAPAVAERALREPGYPRAARVEMLRAALQSDDADVYWQLFRQTWNADDETQAALGLAWLIAACRKGYDCSPQAPWYRAGECASGSQQCLPAQSAVAHYWYASSAPARDSAFALAQRIEIAASATRWEEVPLPPLRGSDSPETLARSAQIHADDKSSSPTATQLRAE